MVPRQEDVAGAARPAPPAPTDQVPDAFWRAAAERLPVGLAACDAISGKISAANLAFADLVGLSPESVPGVLLPALLSHGSPPLRQRWQGFLERAAAGEPVSHAWSRPARRPAPDAPAEPLRRATVTLRSWEGPPGVRLLATITPDRPPAGARGGWGEEERSAIAREIHDQIGQGLTALSLDLGWLLERLPAEPQELRQRTLAMLSLVGDKLDAARDLSTRLRPAILDSLGLVPALEWLASGFQERTGCACRVREPHSPLPLRSDVESALYRVAEEALTNVARHAGARSVEIRLSKAGDDALLEVADDGRGMGGDALLGASGQGIRGMRERAEGVGGSLAVRRGDPAGTIVSARVPR